MTAVGLRWLRWFRALLAATLVFAAGSAAAHKPSDSYLSLSATPEAGRFNGRWDIALRDLDSALALDADGNGEITWGEVRARHDEIARYALTRLKLRVGSADCALEPGAQQIDEHTDGANTVLPFVARCADASGAPLEIEYRLFADLDPQHRGLLALTLAGATRTAVLGPSDAIQRFDAAQPERWRQFFSYVGEGVWHIWIGLDHILFLISLLLPAVLLLTGPPPRWSPVPRFAPAAWDVLRVVTAFTVAHSITLSSQGPRRARRRSRASNCWCRPRARATGSPQNNFWLAVFLRCARHRGHGKTFLGREKKRTN